MRGTKVPKVPEALFSSEDPWIGKKCASPHGASPGTYEVQYVRSREAERRSASVTPQAVRTRGAECTHRAGHQSPQSSRGAFLVLGSASQSGCKNVAHPRTVPFRALWSYNAVDLVRRNVFVAQDSSHKGDLRLQPPASTECDSGGWGKGRAQCFLPTHLTPGTPRLNENPPPRVSVRELVPALWRYNA